MFTAIYRLQHIHNEVVRCLSLSIYGVLGAEGLESLAKWLQSSVSATENTTTSSVECMRRLAVAVGALVERHAALGGLSATPH